MALDEQVKHLKARARLLDKKSDELNSVLEHLEDDLDGVGVAVWLDTPEHILAVTLEDGENGRIYGGYLLGYQKMGGAWRISALPFDGAVVGPEGALEVPPGYPATPLASAPRVVRLEAVEHLPALVAALTARVDAFITNIDLATSRSSLAGTSGGSR